MLDAIVCVCCALNNIWSYYTIAMYFQITIKVAFCILTTYNLEYTLKFVA